MEYSRICWSYLNSEPIKREKRKVWEKKIFCSIKISEERIGLTHTIETFVRNGWLSIFHFKNDILAEKSYLGLVSNVLINYWAELCWFVLFLLE